MSSRGNVKKEADKYLRKMQDRFSSCKQEWEALPDEVYQNTAKALTTDMKTEFSQDYSQSGMHYNVDIILNADAAQTYLKTAEANITKQIKAFAMNINDFEAALARFQNQGLDAETMEELVDHFCEWVDYAEVLKYCLENAEYRKKLPASLAEKKEKWRKSIEAKLLWNDAVRFGVPLELVQIHRDYENAKEHVETAGTSKCMNEAADLLEQLGDYRDAKALAAEARERAKVLLAAEEAQRVEKARLKQLSLEKAERLRPRLEVAAGKIACSQDHCVALRYDGRVFALGENNHGQCNVSTWQNVVAVACNHRATIGLTEQGRVLYAGERGFNMEQCTGWWNIKQIAMSSTVVYGLCENGRVLATSQKDLSTRNSVPDVTAWKNIVSLRAGFDKVMGIRKDGSTVALTRNDFCLRFPERSLNELNGVTDAAVDYSYHNAVLYRDGRFSMTDSGRENEFERHSDIVKIQMLGSCPVAILMDGSLLFSSKLSRIGNRAVPDYVARNIHEPVVAICGNDSLSLILTNSGQVHAVCNIRGWKISSGQCFGESFRAFKGNYHQMMDEKEAEEARLQKEREEWEARAKVYQEQGLCRHCGGTFKKGLFSTKCTACGHKKDY